MDNVFYVGIDCGLDGAVAVISGNGTVLRTLKMPVVSKGKGRKIDLPELWRLIWNPSGLTTREVRIFTVGIEDPGGHAPSAAGLRSMTYSFAVCEAYVSASRHRYATYGSQAWQKTFWKKPKMAKGQKFDTKGAALSAARRLWPEQSFLASDRSKIPHDGIVDALLIAEHTRREFK